MKTLARTQHLHYLCKKLAQVYHNDPGKSFLLFYYSFLLSNLGLDNKSPVRHYWSADVLLINGEKVGFVHTSSSGGGFYHTLLSNVICDKFRPVLTMIISYSWTMSGWMVSLLLAPRILNMSLGITIIKISEKSEFLLRKKNSLVQSFQCHKWQKLFSCKVYKSCFSQTGSIGHCG